MMSSSLYLRLPLVLVLLLLVAGSTGRPAFAQKESTTPIKSLVVIPLHLQPKLSVEAALDEPSGNDTLDVAETGHLTVTVRNEGGGMAQGVEVWVEPQSRMTDVQFEAQTTEDGAVRVGQMETLWKEESETFQLPLAAAETLSGNAVRVAVNVRERHGFGPSTPHMFTIPVETYRPPSLALVGFSVENAPEPALRADTTNRVLLEVQNEGLGPGRKIRARVTVEDGGTLASEEEVVLGTIAPGRSAPLAVQVAVAPEATSVPVSIALRSSEDPYTAAERITLPVSIPDQPPLVDRDIPTTDMERTDAVAVVIGVRTYEDPEVPNVDFAVRDAQVMKEYLIRTFGYRPGNILYLENPSQSALNRVFGTAADHRGQLYDYLRTDSSEVFVYYSGHGAPNQNEGGRTYFVPSDGAPNQLQFTGYPVDQLYENLAKTTKGPVTVAIDACFSGQSDGGVLLSNASPALLQVENPMVGMEQGLVLAAGKADQISSWHPEKKHGLFTYFLLKGLRGDADGNENREITGLEMKQYLDGQVPYWARRLHSRTQNPQVMGMGGNRVLVRLRAAEEEMGTEDPRETAGSEG